MSKIVVTVMGKTVGTWRIVPYSRRLGRDDGARYEVPLYEVAVGAGLAHPTFKAVRFGLVNKGEQPPPSRRVCDAGLAQAQTALPSWVPTYMPHSFIGGIRPGAWQLYPGKDFLIHEGTPDITINGGSLGCIEIVGQLEWNRFLDTIEAQAGADCATIGRRRDLKVVIHAAQRPAAVLVSGP